MIIVSTSPQVCDNEKIAISFLGKDEFIASMEKMAECQGEYGMLHDLDDAIRYFEDALQMCNTNIVTEKGYKARQGEWHETIEHAAYGLGWQE